MPGSPSLTMETPSSRSALIVRIYNGAVCDILDSLMLVVGFSPCHQATFGDSHWLITTNRDTTIYRAFKPMWRDRHNLLCSPRMFYPST